MARLGGDEFCVLSTFYDTKEECFAAAKHCAANILRTIKDSYSIEGHHLYISASIGVSVIGKPDIQADTFIKEADIAMYEAKAQGRDGIIVFNDELSKRVERKLEIERLLHFSIEKNEICLNYQPQVNRENEVIGCEVLVRWHNEKLGQVSSEEFVPIAEQTGFIIELGHDILEESLKTLKEWEEKGINLQQLSINISMRQLFYRDFVSDVKQLCETYLTKEQRSKIVFEITETVVAEDIQKLITIMKVFREYGIRFSMDDFGTG